MMSLFSLKIFSGTLGFFLRLDWRVLLYIKKVEAELARGIKNRDLGQRHAPSS